MADNPGVYTCRAGDDPTNPRTTGAIATIYKGDTSVYHLSPKDAKSSTVSSSDVRGFLHGLGLPVDPPELTRVETGNFRHSQDKLTPNGNINISRDPLGLRDGLERINAQFGQDGKLKACTVLSLDGHLSIPAVAPASTPASAPVKKAEASFEPSPMG